MWLLRLLLRLCHVDRKHATPERASFIRGPCPAGGLTPLAPSHVSLSCYAGDRGRRDLHRWGSQLFIPYSPRKRSLSSHSPCFLLDTALMYRHDKMQNAPRHRVLGPQQVSRGWGRSHAFGPSCKTVFKAIAWSDGLGQASGRDAQCALVPYISCTLQCAGHSETQAGLFSFCRKRNAISSQ